MVDSVSQHGEFHLAVNMEGAQPFRPFVQADLEFKRVPPIFAQLPALADLAYFRPQLAGATYGIEQIAAIRLWEKIVNHAIAHMFAMGAVVTSENWLHRRPHVVD